MFNSMRIYCPGLFICAIVFLFLNSHSFATDQKRSINLSEAEIIAMIDKAKPLIEEVTGRKFKYRMKHEVIERGKLYDILRKSSSSLYKKNLKNFDGETITHQAENRRLKGRYKNYAQDGDQRYFR